MHEGNDGFMTNTWNERFSTEEYVYGKEPNQFVVEGARHLPKGKVLCIAEGEGRNSVSWRQLATK